MAAKTVGFVSLQASAPAIHGLQSQGTCRNSATICGPRSGRRGSIAVCTRAAVVMALSLILLACVSASPPHIGKTARPDNRFPLADLPEGEATWSAKDLNLHYKAATVGNNLEISGFVEFNSNLAKYPTVNAFRIYLHFLDAAGIVLETKLLWVTGVSVDHRFVRWTFQRQWPPPPGTVAIGFSYRGGVGEPGGDSSFSTSKTGWEVYQSP